MQFLPNSGAQVVPFSSNPMQSTVRCFLLKRSCFCLFLPSLTAKLYVTGRFVSKSFERLSRLEAASLPFSPHIFPSSGSRRFHRTLITSSNQKAWHLFCSQNKKKNNVNLEQMKVELFDWKAKVQVFSLSAWARQRMWIRTRCTAYERKKWHQYCEK